MNAGLLKAKITETLWQIVDENSDVVSATLTGSFLHANSLAGLSDIDFVVVVKHLNVDLFNRLNAECQTALIPVLKEFGYDLLINPTLGPLKFNQDRLAVLHLMLYSLDAHVDHVINSPFTCLDWQQTGISRKHSLAECYPVFRLQPRHFISARRGISEYLNDYRSRTVSFRELRCDENGYHEAKQSKPMNARDRHEFAYHVVRFLMRNLIKLVKPNQPQSVKNEDLLDSFHQIFPECAEQNSHLLYALAKMKRECDFSSPLDNLDTRLESFIATYEKQFRAEFVDGAVRHIAFRHAPTPLHRGELRFVGRTDPDIDGNYVEHSGAWPESVELPSRFYTSPLLRCQSSLSLAYPKMENKNCSIDTRLIEIDYGDFEGLTTSQAKVHYPDIFEAWGRGEDPSFPSGESTQQVLDRIGEFVREHWAPSQPSSAVCTHNVVLRCLVGSALGMPMPDWHRISIPYFTPIEFVSTKRFGLFVNLNPSLELSMFRSFQWQEKFVACRS